jgi:hypothetical protein
VVRAPEHKTGSPEGAVKTKSTLRLVLQIDMLGQAASVEIDTEMIELVDESG